MWLALYWWWWVCNGRCYLDLTITGSHSSGQVGVVENCYHSSYCACRLHTFWHIGSWWSLNDHSGCVTDFVLTNWIQFSLLTLPSLSLSPRLHTRCLVQAARPGQNYCEMGESRPDVVGSRIKSVKYWGAVYVSAGDGQQQSHSVLSCACMEQGKQNI